MPPPALPVPWRNLRPAVLPLSVCTASAPAIRMQNGIISAPPHGLANVAGRGPYSAIWRHAAAGIRSRTVTGTGVHLTRRCFAPCGSRRAIGSGEYPQLGEWRGDVPDRLQAGRQGSQVAGLEPERWAAGDLDGHLALQ